MSPLFSLSCTSGSTDMPVSAPAASPRGPVYRAVRRSIISRRRTISFRPRRDTPCGRRWSMHSARPHRRRIKRSNRQVPQGLRAFLLPAGLSGDDQDHDRGPLGSCVCAHSQPGRVGRAANARGHLDRHAWCRRDLQLVCDPAKGESIIFLSLLAAHALPVPACGLHFGYSTNSLVKRSSTGCAHWEIPCLT